ncbi:MAG: M12 family metallo-peptidase [Pseudomonadota bacterium]
MAQWHKAFLISVAAWVLHTPALAADNMTISYSETIDDIRFAKIDSVASAKTAAGTDVGSAGFKLQFDGLDRHFDIDLAPNHALTRHAGSTAKAHAQQTFRGKLSNTPGSWARLTIIDGMPQGLIWDGQQMFAMDAVDSAGNAVDEHAVAARLYRLNDVHFAPGSMRCPDLTHGHETAAQLLTPLAPAAALEPQQAAGASSEIQVGVLSDSLFTVNNNNTEAELIARMNIVDGIFSQQTGVQITIARIDIFDNSNDPFSEVTDSRDLLDELSDYRGSSSTQRNFGLTHLFTGRDLDGSTVGIAWRRALCRNTFGSALTQATRSTTVDAIIAAHEFGHNFGAPHDGEDGSTCEAEPQTFLMAPRVNNSQTFSNCSLDEIASHVAQSSCITPIAVDEVSISTTSNGSDVLLGDSGTAAFTAVNAGTDTLSNVVITVEIAANATLASVSASAGTCNIAAGVGTCTVDTLAQGAGIDVTAVVDTTAPGDANVTASVTADGDNTPNNNSTDTTITVQPAVDLSVRIPATTQVNVDGTTTVNVTVTNAASIAATDVGLAVAPVAAGVQVSAITWADGNCQIADGAATCTAATLSANASSAVSVELTGVQLGDETVNVTVTSSEVDRDDTNNSDSGSITVSEAPATPAPTPGGVVGGSDSGGGAAGTATVLALLMLLAGRRRKY